LDYIDVYLDFNYNYNLVLTEKKLNCSFSIKWVHEPTCLTH